ncbi:unnamed protein product [Amoebophrya sp. A25]|nr:unnamed protein product [Amoebophrya sp. A25]|eukprot:GSA25T00008499001.1
MIESSFISLSLRNALHPIMSTSCFSCLGALCGSKTPEKKYAVRYHGGLPMLYDVDDEALGSCLHHR